VNWGPIQRPLTLVMDESRVDVDDGVVSRETPRMRREWRTIEVMVRMYCRAHHGSGPCGGCDELLAYARRRLDRCPFATDKPTCARCPVHCYRPSDRERVRDVMRWAGPRMIWRHPWLAVMHVIDGRVERKLIRRAQRGASITSVTSHSSASRS
jgi:hypothetical protein